MCSCVTHTLRNMCVCVSVDAFRPDAGALETPHTIQRMSLIAFSDGRRADVNRVCRCRDTRQTLDDCFQLNFVRIILGLAYRPLGAWVQWEKLSVSGTLLRVSLACLSLHQSAGSEAVILQALYFLSRRCGRNEDACA